MQLFYYIAGLYECCSMYALCSDPLHDNTGQQLKVLSGWLVEQIDSSVRYTAVSFIFKNKRYFDIQ